MKFSCLANELAIALQNASKVVATRSSLAVIEGILLEATQDHVCLVGYNFDVAITTTIDAKVEAEGKIVLGAKLFTEIVRRIPEGVVQVETQDLHLKITNNSSEFNIVGLEANEYPELPQVAAENTITMDAEKFKNLVNKTTYAASTDETKLLYTGVLMSTSGKSMTMVALDGFRLAIKKEAINPTGEISIICPSKSLQEVARLVSSADPEIFIDISSSYAMFQTSNCKVISKLLEGKFLDYETTIPKEFRTRIVVKTQDFIASIERTSVIVQDKLKAPITLELRKMSVHLSCEGSTGWANDELPCSVEGEELRISFNSRLLLEALRVCGTEEICLKFLSDISPVVLEPATDEENFLFLVLPVRTNSGTD